MQLLIFTLAGAMLYLFADWLLRRLEARRGGQLPYRQLVFFAIILPLALVAFELIQRVAVPGS